MRFTLCSDNHSQEKPKSWPLALSIKAAAKEVGIGRSQFYTDYIKTGRIHLIPHGTRRLVDSDELYSAWQSFKAEARAALTPEEPRRTSRGAQTG